MQGSLAQNSLQWAVFEDQTEEEWLRDIDLGADGIGKKAERMKQWSEEWAEFCGWVVTEFGDRV
jgi:hypothetical protein